MLFLISKVEVVHQVFQVLMELLPGNVTMQSDEDGLSRNTFEEGQTYKLTCVCAAPSTGTLSVFLSISTLHILKKFYIFYNTHIYRLVCHE